MSSITRIFVVSADRLSPLSRTGKNFNPKGLKLSLIMVALLGNCFGASLFGMPKRVLFTKDEVNLRLLKKGIQVVGEYHGTARVNTFRCSFGHEWADRGGNLISGKHGCAACSGRSHPQAKADFLSAATKLGYTILGEYVRSIDPVLMMCPKGHVIKQRPQRIKNGTLCIKCAGRCPSQSREWFEKEALKRGYQIHEAYQKNHTKVLMECQKGHLFKITPSHFKTGKGCAICAKYGFKSAIPTDFYVYKMSRCGVNAVGFGVSNNFKIRDRQHRLVFSKTNTIATLEAIFHFETGVAALAVESVLKNHIHIFDFGIKGFRSECLPIQYFEYVLRVVATTGVKVSFGKDDE